MVQLHFERNAVTCKIVYYGPGLSGKTTNLEIIHNKAPADSRGEMVSIATRGDRTLYFDYLPLDLGQIQGMQTTFQLYTVPGQIYYNNTRKLVLQGVDGIVFVADSSAEKLEENKESLANLRENLSTIDLDLGAIPLVIQYNKRDLPNAMPLSELDAHLNPQRRSSYEAIAKDGQGVFATLKEIGRLVIETINHEQASSGRRRTTNAVPQTAQPTPAPAPQNTATTPISPEPVQAMPPRPSVSATTPLQGVASPRHSTPLPMTPTPRVGNAGPFPSPPSPMGEQTRKMAGSAEAQKGATRKMRQPGSSSKRPAVPQARGRTTTMDATGPRGRTTEVPQPGKPGNSSKSSRRGASAKDRHLQKAKPPPLSERTGTNKVNLGNTEPHLRRYRDQDEEEPRKGSFLRFVVILFFLVLILVIIFALLVVFVPPVNEAILPYLPEGLQEMLRHSSAG